MYVIILFTVYVQSEYKADYYLCLDFKIKLVKLSNKTHKSVSFIYIVQTQKCVSKYICIVFVYF